VEVVVVVLGVLRPVVLGLESILGPWLLRRVVLAEVFGAYPLDPFPGCLACLGRYFVLGQ